MNKTHPGIIVGVVAAALVIMYLAYSRSGGQPAGPTDAAAQVKQIEEAAMSKGGGIGPAMPDTVMPGSKKGTR